MCYQIFFVLFVNVCLFVLSHVCYSCLFSCFFYSFIQVCFKISFFNVISFMFASSFIHVRFMDSFMFVCFFTYICIILKLKKKISQRRDMRKSMNGNIEIIGFSLIKKYKRKKINK